MTHTARPVEEVPGWWALQTHGVTLGKSPLLVTGHQSFSVQWLVALEMLIGHSLNLLPLPKCTLIGHGHNFSILKVIS